MKILSTVVAIMMSISSTVSSTVTGFTFELSDYEPADEQFVTCSVVAENVSLGNIIEPTEVLFNDESCAEIFVNLLEDNGYTSIYSGTTKEGFYLSAIEGIDTSIAHITEEAKQLLDEKGVSYTNGIAVKDCLSEFDFTDSSGWIFAVNGEIPSVGMCDYIPSNGDEITLYFTLHYGDDIAQ